MDARITVLTLGVDDLEKALRFYREGLAWALTAVSVSNLNTAQWCLFNCNPTCVWHCGHAQALRMTPSGVVTPATFRTLTGTSGKWSGTRNGLNLPEPFTSPARKPDPAARYAVNVTPGVPAPYC